MNSMGENVNSKFKENNNSFFSESEKSFLNKKKATVFIIVLMLILILIACFFVHNITDRGQECNNNGVSKVPVIDYSNRIKVRQRGETEFNSLQELDMFNNAYFNDNAIIAPGVDGEYSFTVENESEEDFIYDLSFIEHNIYNINMVYKIRRNGEYILGNDDNWVTHNNYYWKKIPLSAYSTDVYTVEWKWEDAENDTEVGKTPGANYKMKIRVDAEQVTKER